MWKTTKIASCIALACALATACASSDSGGAAEPKAGAPCTTDGIGKCDGPAAVLTCVKGTYERSACLGANGCKSTDTTTAVCDTTLANLDDTCSPDGVAACTTDGARLLACAGEKFVLKSECRGPAKCAVNGTAVQCDQSKGNLDDACSLEGSALCSTDDTKVFKCVSGKVVAVKDCTDGTKCTETADAIDCL